MIGSENVSHDHIVRRASGIGGSTNDVKLIDNVQRHIDLGHSSSASRNN